jgi:hypothetical protein
VYPHTATYPIAPDRASLLRWVSALPGAPQPRSSASYRGGLQRCHVPHGPGARLPIKVGSGAATCPAVLDLTSLLRWALTPPRVPRPRTSPPY